MEKVKKAIDEELTLSELTHQIQQQLLKLEIWYQQNSTTIGIEHES
jgi:hypothetical protein